MLHPLDYHTRNQREMCWDFRPIIPIIYYRFMSHEKPASMANQLFRLIVLLGITRKIIFILYVDYPGFHAYKNIPLQKI